MRAKDALGRYGENVAAAHLSDAGLEILARNWRCEEGEIDIVALDGDCVVVCEVKTRRSLLAGTPAHADYRITRDHGGLVDDYKAKYGLIRDRGERVVIDGICNSACTLVLGIVPLNRICATPRALVRRRSNSARDMRPCSSSCDARTQSSSLAESISSRLASISSAAACCGAWRRWPTLPAASARATLRIAFRPWAAGRRSRPSERP